MNLSKLTPENVLSVVTNNLDKDSVKQTARLLIEQMMHSVVDITAEAMRDPQNSGLTMPDTQDVKNAAIDFLRDMLMDLENSLVDEIQDAAVVVKIKPTISFEATLENA